MVGSCRFLRRRDWLCLLGAAFSEGFRVGFVAQLSAADRARIHDLFDCFLACVGLFLVLWSWGAARTRTLWFRPGWEVAIERAEIHARTLLRRSRGNEPLLNYARECLRQQADSREWNVTSLTKDVGLVSLGAAAVAVLKEWGSIKMSLDGAHWPGVNTSALVPMMNVVLWVLLPTSVLGIIRMRTTIGRYTYRLNLIDTAIRLKSLDDEAKTCEGAQVPLDNG